MSRPLGENSAKRKRVTSACNIRLGCCVVLFSGRRELWAALERRSKQRRQPEVRVMSAKLQIALVFGVIVAIFVVSSLFT